MSSINKEKIITLISEANKALNVLKEYKEYDQDQLLSAAIQREIFRNVPANF